MNASRSLCFALSLATLASCASEANIARLDEYKRGCATGDAVACRLIPVQTQINKDEAQSNALKGIALGLVLVPLVLLAGAAAAPPPMPPPPRPIW